MQLPGRVVAFFYYLCTVKDSTARNIAISIVAAAALLVGAIAGSRLLRKREPHVEIDHMAYPVKGVDLSAHNGIVDFDSLAAAGVSFAYLKASEGLSFRDPSFVVNYAKCRRAGIAVGAYHFFRFDCDGRQQAINLLKATGGCLLDLPVGIDIEEWGNPAGHSTEIIRERLRTMTALLNAAGYRVIIYTNKQGHSRFVRDNFDSDESPALWICSFTDPPIAHQPWVIWQHSHVGRIPGVKGPVDLNVFNGDTAQWAQWRSAGQ